MSEADDEYTSQLHGRTSQPVIAERELVRVGSGERVTIRVHQPEPIVGSPDGAWRCGYRIVGIPELPTLYEPPFVLSEDDVFFGWGEDSFQALAGALANIRGMIDHAAEQLGVEFAWPARADWGPMLPYWVNQMYGRAFERRLIDAMQREEARLIAERVPNPYPWDDPRHPSQIVWPRRRGATG